MKKPTFLEGLMVKTLKLIGVYPSDNDKFKIWSKGTTKRHYKDYYFHRTTGVTSTVLVVDFSPEQLIKTRVRHDSKVNLESMV